MLDLFLIGAVDDQRDRLRELEQRAAVERGEKRAASSAWWSNQSMGVILAMGSSVA
jgi:hypothetical protein